MQQIILSKCDDGAMWVTSDEDQIGTESYFKRILHTYIHTQDR